MQQERHRYYKIQIAYVLSKPMCNVCGHQSITHNDVQLLWYIGVAYKCLNELNQKVDEEIVWLLLKGKA